MKPQTVTDRQNRPQYDKDDSEFTQSHPTTNLLQSSIFNLQSSTFNLQSSISNLQSPIFNFQPSIFNLQSSILNLESSIFNFQFSIFNLESGIFNLKYSVVYVGICDYFLVNGCDTYSTSFYFVTYLL